MRGRSTACPGPRFTASAPFIAVGIGLGLFSCSDTEPQRATGAPSSSRPNVIWICVDTLRADHLSCYGYSRPTSPALDQLASTGFVFERAYSQSSWTKPSVPSLFTALYPTEHGVFEGSSKDKVGRITSDLLGESLTTAAEYLAEDGYATVGFVHNSHLKAFLGFGQGFDVYEVDDSDAEQVNQKFWDWYARTDRGRPFLAYLHYLDVHWPYRPGDDYAHLFDPPQSDLDLSGANAGKLRDQINDGEIIPTLGDIDRMIALYDACIRRTDAAIGDLLEELQRLGEDERTIVVVTSDHGEEFYERGKVGHGHSLSEALLRVPLIFSGPGLPAGRSQQPVQLVDVLPTILDLTHVVPEEATSGRSLRPLWEQRIADVDVSPVYAEVLHGRRYQRSIRAGRWKLVETYRRSRQKPTTSEAEPAPGDVLRVGRRVEVKGRFDKDEFIAEELEFEDDADDDFELRGPLQARTGRVLSLGPFRIEVAKDADILRRSTDQDFELQNISSGMIIEAEGDLTESFVLDADELEWRDDKSGDDVKLEAKIARVDAKRQRIWLGAVQVSFESELELPPIVGGVSETRAISPDQLADEQLYQRSIELYDVEADPTENDDLSKVHPDAVEALSRQLAQWASSRHRFDQAVGQRELDADTIAELRNTGYVE